MENLSKLIEGILFVAGEPVSFLEISEKLEIEKEEVEKAILDLQKEREESGAGIQVLVFNEKAQLCSNKQYAENISIVLNPKREKMLTKILLEVCGIIAYKQPITRLEVENIRGGASCDYAINTLLENNLIEIVGRKDAVGKPLLFGTTDNFLKKFNISSLSELPDYDQLLERIKVLHEEKDNSLFDYSRMPNVEEDEEEISDEEAEEIIQGIKESREEIIEDRTKLDDLLASFTSDLKDIPDYKFDIDEL